MRSQRKVAWGGVRGVWVGTSTKLWNRVMMSARSFHSGRVVAGKPGGLLVIIHWRKAGALE